MEVTATRSSAAALDRLVFARVGLAPLAYFALAGVATYLAPTQVKLLLCCLFGVGVAAVALLPGGRRLLLSQWSRTRKHPRVSLAAVPAGVLFYLATFFAMATDAGQISGWHFRLEYILLSGLAIPFVEEFLFRGVAIARSNGREAWIAAALAAIFFAMIHPDRWLGTFLFSLVAAAFYLRGGLGAAWGFHAAYNLSNYAVLLWFSANNA